MELRPFVNVRWRSLDVGDAVGRVLSDGAIEPPEEGVPSTFWLSSLFAWQSVVPAEVS